MWTANITAKDIVNGALRLTVAYTDGEHGFIHTFDTADGQSDTWINRIIWNKIQDLNEVTALETSIQIGEFVPTAPVFEPPDTPRELYANKLALYYRMTNMIDVGIIASNNSDYVALKLWLKNNFIQSYNTLF